MFSIHSRFAGELKHMAAVSSNSTRHANIHTSGACSIVHRTNHYTLLGVPTSANHSDIKKAFYKSSMKWHPDRNQGSNNAHQKFLKINEAYSILGNEQSRRAYDRSLQIRTTSSYSGNASAHRHHNTAFSSSGEYSSRKAAPDERAGEYRRSNGAYPGNSRAGQRPRSNFAEWEQRHYQEMKKKAEDIGRHAKETAGTSRYSNTQIAIYQFWELVAAAAFVFGVAWAGSSFVRVSAEERDGVTKKPKA